MLTPDFFDLFIERYNFLSLLDALRADPAISALLKLPKTYLYAIVACFLLLLWPFLSNASHTKSSNPRIYLPALSTLVVPTRNARGIMALVPHTTHKQNIILPLTPLMDKISSGDVELRRAVEDLSDLFQDRLRVYGWNIVLDIELWRPKVICWLFKVHFYYHKKPVNLPDVPMLSLDPKTLHLNTIPPSKIRSAVQNHLTQRRSTLEFTTLAPNVPWMSREFILSAVPFLQRSGTPTPLLTSLIDILKVDARIKTVENVSVQYATLLATTEQKLVEERATRSQFICTFGLEKWREHRFLLAWEAALLHAGLISRWIVVFKKHEM
ncbi:hypothetical protein BDZ89DRAFT_1043934 [Hymenopellis radicata]|nr:hypothetical protein BDZ89DRAFT_1043934 [Hymenopellis radicata]